VIDGSLLSARNPRVQRLRRLSSRRAERAATGSFVIDGPVLVAEALDSGLVLDSVFVDDAADAEAVALAARAAAAGVEVHRLAPGVLERVADTVTSRGVAAVGTVPVCTLDAVAPEADVLVLVGVADPGNAGTLIRVAEAAEMGAVVFCGDAVDPFAPKVVRASAGALFRVAVISGGDPVEVLDRLGGDARRLVGTSPHRGADYDTVDLSGPTAFVLGSEAQGLGPEVAAAVDTWVRIPMGGRVESLNVAMTGTVLCFEAARQRRGGPRR
jgi:TrmH family RNA methyltransferase